MGPGENPQLTMARGCRVQERGYLRAWGAWNLICARGGRFDARARKSSPLGSISVGRGENPRLMMAGGCWMRREVICRPGGLGTRDARGGAGLTRVPKIRAPWARYRRDLEKALSGRCLRTVGCSRGASCGPGGLGT